MVALLFAPKPAGLDLHAHHKVTGVYPEIEPYANGMLDVGDGNSLYRETCGDPRGKPAVVLHGGPGSGCSPWHRGLFDPGAYRLVLFDQRNCERSRPHAADPATDLEANTTANLIEDVELLRRELGVDRWLVLGVGQHAGARLRRSASGSGHGDDPVRRHDRAARGVRLALPRRVARQRTAWRRDSPTPSTRSPSRGS
jgi:proline iminopeptidase